MCGSSSLPVRIFDVRCSAPIEFVGAKISRQFERDEVKILNVRGRKVRIARNTMSYTGRSSKPRMSRRRALPAHFLAPDDNGSETAHPSNVYPGLVDEYENDEENEDLPEIAYFWD